MLASLALALFAAQSVQLEDVCFLDSFGELTSIDSAVTLDASSAGNLIVEFDFQSPLFDAAAGLYELRPMRALWRLSDGSGHAPSSGAGGWHGARDPAPAPIIQAFDRQTGAGRVQVRLPFATGLSSERRHGSLGEGLNLVELAVGWQGEVEVSSGGSVSNAMFLGQTTFSSAYPDRWVDIEAPLVGIPAEFVATVYVMDGLQSPRTLTIQNAFPSTVEFTGPEAASGGVVTIPAGSSFHEFTLRALATGSYHLTLLDQSGAEVGTSSRATVDREVPVEWPEYAGHVVSGSEEAASVARILLPPGYTPGTPAAIPNTGSSGAFQTKECNPPKCQSVGVTYTACSSCSVDPQIDCPEFVAFASEASCTFALFSVCHKSGTTSITCQAYKADGDPYDQELGCPKLSKKLFDYGTSVQTYKKCCNYEAEAGSTVPLTVGACS